MQNVFIQVLKLHPIAKNRKSILKVAYVITFFVYFIIGWIGGNGIVDRHPIIIGAKTILGYFNASNWQTFMI